MIDKIKLGIAVACVAAGIWAYYWLGEGTAFVLRLLAVVAGILAAAAVAWVSEPGKQFTGFSGEAIKEVEKVGWAPRKETMQTTAAGLAVRGGVAGFFLGFGKK